MRYQIKIEDVNINYLLYKSETSKKLFMKEKYCKSNKKYYAGDYEDICAGAYFKKGKIVFVEYDDSYEKRGIIRCADKNFSYGREK